MHDGKHCISNVVTIVNDRDSILLIQTSKPIYRTGESVDFQVIALDDSARSVKIERIFIEVFDGKQNLVDKIDTNYIEHGEYGLYSGSFDIADAPNTGVWNISARINDEEVSLAKTFIVEDYKAPRFKLHIDAPARVPFSRSTVTLKLHGRYSFEKSVIGDAVITARVFYVHNPHKIVREFSKTVKIEGNEEVVVDFHTKTDMKLNFLLKNILVDFDVELIESRTGQSVKATKRVEIVAKSEYVIDVVRKDSFRPGMPYCLKVSVDDVNGQPVPSRSIPVILNTKKININDERSRIIDYRVHAFLVNGKVNFIVYPSKDVTTLEFEVSYEGVVDRFSVPAQGYSDDETLFQIDVLSSV
jgi:CD109 antigen